MMVFVAEVGVGGYVCLGLGIFFVLALMLKGISSSPSQCSVCQLDLKRKHHTWQGQQDGKPVTLHLCPKCNATFERKQSKSATDKFFGGR